ncbi:tripartite motif-containing protein 40 [Drosophila subobscura]|uniref:tripartite motif-containing protein 40 n=1 Tax=Drosophila subobscura TaxID=7241 RepID=UPI00155B0550|nr:tripartite motif-containing protein 40 [Drosophila subobscura]
MSAKKEVCVVCLSKKRHQVYTKCQHSFCRRCLRRVYFECPTKNCPLCRHPIGYYVRYHRKGLKISFFF